MEKVIEYLNKFLQYDGFEIRKDDLRCFIFPKKGVKAPNQVASLTPLQQLAHNFDYHHLLKVIETIQDDIDEDPRSAIGAAKELIESVCKTILSELSALPTKNLELQPLVKLTQQHLRLVPENIPNHAKGAEQIRNIMGGLSTVTHNMGELRNLFGSGHGKDGKWVGLNPRHARLAVGAATTLALFLFETYQEQQ